MNFILKKYMRHFVLFCLCSALIPVFESCNAIYVPATPSTPVFAKGNSLKLNTTVGATGLNASLDYSPITHYYLGGEWHGTKLDSNSHLNAGAHVGYYFSPNGENSILNFQVGYNYGNGHYADVYDSTDSHLYKTNFVYETYHVQVFYVNDYRQSKFFGVGLRYDYYHGNYANEFSPFFIKSIPRKTSLPMAFVFFEYSFGRNSTWNLNATGGVQLSTANITDKDISQDVPGFYTNFFFRAGIAYQIHFGKK